MEFTGADGKVCVRAKTQWAIVDKELGRPILIDENTRQGIDDGIAVEAQREVLMKGKTEPTKVYAVLVDAVVAETA